MHLRPPSVELECSGTVECTTEQPSARYRARWSLGASTWARLQQPVGPLWLVVYVRSPRLLPTRAWCNTVFPCCSRRTHVQQPSKHVLAQQANCRLLNVAPLHSSVASTVRPRPSNFYPRAGWASRADGMAVSTGSEAIAGNSLDRAPAVGTPPRCCRALPVVRP